MGIQFATVTEYIESFEGVTQARLREVRTLAEALLPDAVEAVHYNIPAYSLKNSWVFYFSGYAKHVSLAFGGRIDAMVEAFAGELKPYKTSASAVQLRHEEPIPTDLIARLVQYRCQHVGRGQ